MRKSFIYLKQKITYPIKATVVLAAAVLLLTTTTLFAAPPGSQYNPAETLDPSCEPGDLNCSVLVASDITIGDDVISGTADRVLFLDSSGNLDDSANFTFDDSGSFDVTLTPNAGYTESITITDDFLGLGIEAAVLVHEETASGDKAFVSVGDNTDIGGDNTTLLLGYVDGTLSNNAMGTFGSNEINLDLLSDTGDDINRGLFIDNTQVQFYSINNTTNLGGSFELNDTQGRFAYNTATNTADLILDEDDATLRVNDATYNNSVDVGDRDIFLTVDDGTEENAIDINSSGVFVNIGDTDSPAFEVRDGTFNGIIEANTNDFLVSLGDIDSAGNSTLLTLDDANETFSVNSSAQAGFTESIETGSNLAGIGFQGAGIIRSNTGTGENASIFVGDGTALGGSSSEIRIGYADATFTNRSTILLEPDDLNITLISTTGDDIDHGISIDTGQLNLGYENNTSGVSNYFDLHGTGSTITLSGGGSTAFSVYDETLDVNVFDVTDAGLVTVNEEYALPTTDGSADQVLQTDGLGTVGWADADSLGLWSLTGSTLYDNRSGNGSMTGTNNFLAGDSAGASITSAADNIMIGYQAGQSTTTGGANIFLGASAGASNDSGIRNIFMGTNAGNSNDGGGDNIFLGYRSGQNNTSGQRKIFLGQEAGLNSTTGMQSVIIGDIAGGTLVDGDDNTIIGATADVAASDTQGAIALGHGATAATNEFALPDSVTNWKFQGDSYVLPVDDGTIGQSLQTDGNGTLSWGHTEETTNYHLARERGIGYKEDDFQVQSISEWDDPSYGASHGLIYVAEHDYLFSAVRSSVQPEFTRFNDPDDLSDYTHVDTTGLGAYGYSDQIVYSPTMDKLYMVLNDFTYSQQNMRVIEIDPETLAYTLVIDEDLGAGNRAGAGLLTELDGYLYVVEGYYTSIINKYDLSDYSNVGSLTIADANNAVHSLETDGTNLYFGTTWNSSDHTVGVIDPSTMTLTDSQTYNFGTAVEASSGITDDIVVWGDWLFMPLEGYSAAENKIVQINKSDLTDITYLDFGMTGTRGWYSIVSDGEYLWFGGVGDLFGRFDPLTYTAELFDISDLPGSNVNEIAFDGSRIFVAGYDDPYPAGDAGDSYVARYSILPGVVETFTLDANGNQMLAVDKVNSRVGINDGTPDYALDVNYAAAGVVARFTSTDGNCTIDPAVVGGISCSSDETLKKDIEPIDESQLDKLSQISPVEYHWKNDADEEQKTIGFIAQDVQEILPELVSLDPTTQKLTMSYAGLAVPLVGSVRELGLRLTALEALNDLNINGKTNKITKLFSDFLLTTQRIVINGLAEIKQATIDRLFAKRVETEMFCIDDMCITKDEFKAILDANDLTEKAQNIFKGIEDEALEEILEGGSDDASEEDNESDGSDTEETEDTEESDTKQDDSSGGSDNDSESEEVENDTENQEENTEDQTDSSTETSGGTDSSTETDTEDQSGGGETENTEEGDTQEESEETEEDTTEEDQENTGSETEEIVENTEESDDSTEPEPEPETEEEPEPEPETESESEV